MNFAADCTLAALTLGESSLTEGALSVMERVRAEDLRRRLAEARALLERHGAETPR